jgi:hypothetical protein
MNKETNTDLSIQARPQDAVGLKILLARISNIDERLDYFVNNICVCKYCPNAKVDNFGNYDCDIAFFEIDENSKCEEHSFMDNNYQKILDDLMEEHYQAHYDEFQPPDINKDAG